jgi:hypothetical protein
MLNHRCVQQMFFIARWQCFSVVNIFSAKGWVSILLFLRTAFEHFNDPPANFFRAQIRFPWPVFCCQLLDPAIANVACTLAHMQLACKRTSQMPAHNPELCCSALSHRTLVRRLNPVDAPTPPPPPTLKPPTPKPRRRH